jgi:hypothetical protein
MDVTYYVALPFVAADDGVAAGEAVECFNPNAAVMRAETLSRKPGHVGAVAFSRTGDPATGDFGDATVKLAVRIDVRWQAHLDCDLVEANRRGVPTPIGTLNY